MNPIQLVSEVEISGWSCTFQQEGSGGGEWICHPADETIRPMAEKLWEHWIKESHWRHDAVNPGPWHFWFEAETWLIEEFKRRRARNGS